MKRFFRPKRIELTSSTNLFDYFFLTSIVGAGIFLSIFAFVATIHYQNEDARQSFRFNAEQMHSLVTSKAARFDLQLEVLSQFAAANQSIRSARQVQWLKTRVESMEFTCVSLLRVDPKTNLLWQQKVLKSRSPCKLHDRLEPVVELSDISGPNGSSVAINRIVKLDERGETYLSVTLPKEALSLKSSETMQVSLGIRPLVASAGAREFTLNKEVSVLGSTLLATYTPVSLPQNRPLGWAWIVLAAGMVITLLVGAIIFSLINRNISIQKEVEAKTKDLQVATDRAVYANQTKSRFLANVSHEVRTPLNLILGMAEVLSETPISPEQKNYVETFRRAGNHLLGLVNDILDVASIEAGEIPYEEHDMSLVELVENVSDFISVACRVKKLTFDYEIDPMVPKLVRGDPKRLRQVLINLLNNSLKYTDRGGITLRTKASGPNILFEIQDTGIGIPQGELDKIFGEFYQVDSGLRRARAGVGLGLSIVKTYVEHLRGTIQVQSEVGVGSTFTVSLALSECGPQTWLDQLKTDFQLESPRKAIIISPNTVQSNFMRSCLEPLGYEVSVIESGRSAVKQLKNRPQSNVHYIVDLIGRDIGGLDVLKNLALSPKELKRTTVLCPMVHREKDPEALRALGVETICYAPIKIGALASALKSGPSKSAAVIPPLFDNKKHSVALPMGIRVLIAEDDEDNRFLIQTYLASLNIEVNFANDGKAALERYKSVAPEIDIVITDIQMPQMDGFELIREIRRFEASEHLSRVPIVALTADAQPEQVERVRTLGGDNYLTKPIGKMQLFNLLTQYGSMQRVG